MITRIHVTLTRAITETLGTEFMQLFYEQPIHIHPETPCPLMAIRAHRHLSHNTIAGGLSLKMELPVPCARAKQSCPRCPGTEDIISKFWKRCGAHRSKSRLHQPSPASTHRLHGLVKTTFGPDPFRVTSVIDSSRRFLDCATRNGKHGPMSGTGPSTGGRTATPPQTTTHVEMSGNAS